MSTNYENENEDYIWKTLQKALKKIKEQDKIIKALSLYANQK
jgi:hypothetical protein